MNHEILSKQISSVIAAIQILRDETEKAAAPDVKDQFLDEFLKLDLLYISGKLNRLTYELSAIQRRLEI